LLLELSIRNFAIIEKLDLTLAPGMNVLTGETGAGKSIIIDALGLLLGDRADRTLVRTGVDRAEVEGVVALDGAAARLLRPVLEEYGLLAEEDENLILYRELSASGRSLGRVNGRAVNARLLREIGEVLVDIHGQSEHLSLFRVRNHLDLLDRYADAEASRQELSAGISRLRTLREKIRGLEQERSRQADRIEELSFQIEEIASAELRPGEEAELRQDRQRLQNASRLLESVERLHTVLYGEEGRPTRSLAGGALDLLGVALREMEALVQLDPTLVPQRELLGSVSDQVEDLSHALRVYRDGLDLDPRRLREVEERLIRIRELERKYGPTVEEVLAARERAEEEMAGLSQSEVQLEGLREEEEALLRELGELAGRLSASRQEAAERLGQAIEETMADLNMEGTTFAVQISREQDPSGLWVEGELPFPSGRYAFQDTGIDQVEFFISPNPGEEPRPLVRVASGGESSRLLLAVKSILSQADATPVLIFDEIDAGVGGRSGHVVGEKLWELARHHQVICITHLPQIAAYADVHFSIGKVVQDGRTLTQVAHLEGRGLVEELAVMLGGPNVSAAHRESARQIWEQARQRRILVDGQG
jgi:DNA repair protein RecN (Recombination protein N)